MVILEVSDVFASSEPSFFVFPGLLAGINAGEHSIVEEGVSFSEIDDIDLNRFIFGRVVESEIEPLGVSFGIDIVLHQKIIFIGVNLNNVGGTL